MQKICHVEFDERKGRKKFDDMKKFCLNVLGVYRLSCLKTFGVFLLAIKNLTFDSFDIVKYLREGLFKG